MCQPLGSQMEDKLLPWCKERVKKTFALPWTSLWAPLFLVSLPGHSIRPPGWAVQDVFLPYGCFCHE